MILSEFHYQNKKLTLHCYDRYSIVKYGIILSDCYNLFIKVSYRCNLRSASLRYSEMITELVL